MRISGLLDRPRRFIRRFLIDPLAVKELSGIARRWQLYLGRGIYVGLIGFIVWIFWNALTRRGDWMSPSAYAELGRQLFTMFFSMQMAVVTLGGMSAASDMITREVRNGTLGLLALTPLTPWRIVAGKWKAALLQTSTAILCGIPVLAVCIYLGGVGLWELSYSFTLSIVSAALGAAIALYCSTIFSASYVATIVALISLLVYCIAPVIFLALTRAEDTVMTVLCWTHPLYAATGAVMQGRLASRFSWGYGWFGATLCTAVLIHLLLRASARRVRLLIRRPGGKAAEPPSLEDLRRTPVGQGPRTAKFARFLRGQAGVWENNAILWKELSTRRIGAGKLFRIGGSLLGFLLLTTLVSEGWWRVLVLWFSSLILLLVALANGVSLFVTEREERKWDILLSTPLRAREIVLAKLFAGLAGLAPMAGVMACFWCFAALVYDVSLRGTFMTLSALALATLLTYLLAASASLTAKTQRVAFSSAFGLMIAFLFVLPLVLVMLQEYRIISHNRDFAEIFFRCTNPGAYLAYVSEPLSRSYRSDGWRDHVTREELMLETMFGTYAAGYSTLIVGLVLWMIQRFNRAAGRS
jgi:ABC-type transport system involved in multi-copper enzyme maturation permease subunit